MDKINVIIRNNPQKMNVLLRDNDIQQITTNVNNNFLKGDKGDKGDTGTTNYLDLINKPSINDITLIGNKTLNELNIQPKGDYADTKITNWEIEEIFNDW